MKSRVEINEQIHVLLGWEKIKCDPTYQCPDGYAWKSPNGTMYEGGVHTVPDYCKQIADVAKLLTKLTDQVEGEHPQGVS